MMEVEERIKELIREGDTTKEIAEKIQKGANWIKEQKKELRKEGFITEEDIQIGKIARKKRSLEENPIAQKIFALKRDGIPTVVIATTPEIEAMTTYSTVYKYVREGIKLGIIKEDDNEAEKENKEKEKLKARKRKLEENPIAQEIFELKRQGISTYKITEIPEIKKKAKYSTVFRYVKDGFKLGIIKKDEVEKAEERRKQEEADAAKRNAEILKQQENDKKSQIQNIDEQQLLRFLILGYDVIRIQSKMQINDINEVEEVIDKLVQEGKITKQQINEYIEKRQKEEIEKVFEGLKAGKSQRNIAKDIDSTFSRVRTYIKKIKAEKNITDEDILRWKNEQENSIYKREQAVKEGLKRDLSKNEIIKSYLEQQLNERYVRRTRAKLLGDEDIKAEIEKARKELKIKQLNEIKRSIHSNVKLDIKENAENSEKIREYINLFYEIYGNEKITKSELLFLKQALFKIPIDENDIIQFAKLCMSNDEYMEAKMFVASRNEMPEANISKESENILKKLEATLIKTNKIQQASQIINRGNSNTEIVSSVTGLSKDEVNILKIKLSGKPARFLGIEGREKVIDLLLKDKDSYDIRKKAAITDFEMEDIEDQVRYRRIKANERNVETQIKQDSIIRIIVMLTKLGKKPKVIAKMLKTDKNEIDENEVNEKIEKALQVGLIKEDETQGIDLLGHQELKSKQRQI